ncbi:uroporphyrinogen-III C-methyltransferase [Marinomonas sp. 5E14-1]|uniref:uroporphyrinogen-III C-methyltransferase n=1 Tax=Marinomonas sp. 5E14-1 TaxID=3153922 RepID=UPI003265B477
MTENNKQETSVAEDNHSTQIKDTSDKAETQSVKKDDAQQETPSQGKVKSLVATSLCLSVVALAANGWLYYQSTQSSLSQDITLLQNQQNNLDKKISTNTLNQAQLKTFIEQIRNTDETTQAEKQQLADKQNRQDEQILSLEAKLSRLDNTTKEDWKLAEAEYLIRLANQRLLLESDSNGAITLLNNADGILNELEDPIVFATRKALAKDIQALSSVSQFDLEGAYLKLSALYDNVPTLPQREPSKKWQSSTNETSSIDDNNTEVNSIEVALASFWQSLRSLVVINYDHKPIKTLLPPAEYQELITGLQLQLDVAQVALLKGESVIYQQSLKRAGDAVTEHFDTQSKAVMSFLSNLTSMQQLNPTPSFPLPRDSLTAMKSLMQNWTSKIDSTPSSTNSPIATTPKAVTPKTTTETQSGDEI